MKDFFTEIFEYHHYNNQQLADLLLETSGDFNSVKTLSLFSHIINAHHIWNSRILQRVPDVSVWQVNTLESCRELDKSNLADTMTILSEADLSRRFAYRTSRGDEFENSIQEILFHTANHTTHHRGQIMAELRRNGVEPLVTDYIFYKR